jgi:putative adenylate-forming enzyme
VLKLRATSAIVRSFVSARTRYRRGSRAALLAHQHRAIERFVRTVLPRAPFYGALARGGFDALPIVDKARMTASFAAFNTRGIERDDALAVALAGERSRNFRAGIGDVTVGLSSGTTGNRGVFLVGERERYAWAGIVLAYTLTNAMLARVLSPWRAPLRVALFLRSDSALYGTIASRRIAFDYYDLERPLDELAARLASVPPHAIVAPPSVLRLLARTCDTRRVAPEKIVAVAEVLERDDEAEIEAAFGTPVHQLYQCTEGLLAYTCPLRRLHLNERYVRIETEWLDAERTRFVPIVTDFARTTQIFARYRLDVVLLTAPPCRCGRPERTIAAIEGRADDVLWLDGIGGTRVPVFPDFVRRAMALAGDAVRDYRVRDAAGTLEIALESESPDTARERVRAELDAVWKRFAVRPPALRFVAWQTEEPGRKRRRVIGAPVPAAASVSASSSASASALTSGSASASRSPSTPTAKPASSSSRTTSS